MDVIGATRAETVSFPSGGATRPAYLAWLDGEGPFPGVVVIHEVLGLNDNIREITRRFAEAGYMALAVDLFAGRNRAACMVRVMSGLLLNSLGNSDIRELKDALTYLAARPEADETRLGAISFCMGGGFALAWACTDDRLKAIAPYYGTNPRPLDAVARACPVVGSYPGRDYTAVSARRLDAALDRNDIAHDIKIYPGTMHAFFNDQGPTHQAPAAADSWRRVLAFFGEHLRQP